MTPTSPIFEITKIEHGWAYVTIRVGERRRQLAVSCIFNDGLGSFVAAIEQVVTDVVDGAESLWHHEPDATSVRVRAESWPHVELRIERYRSRRLHAQVDVQDLVRDVITAFERVLDAYGEDGYLERWQHPFPRARLDGLRAWLERDTERRARCLLWSDILKQVICRNELRSAAIAASLGAPHDRVVAVLRDDMPPGLGLELAERPDDGEGAVEVNPGYPVASQDFRDYLCRDE